MTFGLWPSWDQGLYCGGVCVCVCVCVCVGILWYLRRWGLLGLRRCKLAGGEKHRRLNWSGERRTAHSHLCRYTETCTKSVVSSRFCLIYFEYLFTNVLIWLILNWMLFNTINYRKVGIVTVFFSYNWTAAVITFTFSKPFQHFIHDCYLIQGRRAVGKKGINLQGPKMWRGPRKLLVIIIFKSWGHLRDCLCTGPRNLCYGPVPIL